MRWIKKIATTYRWKKNREVGNRVIFQDETLPGGSYMFLTGPAHVDNPTLWRFFLLRGLYRSTRYAHQSSIHLHCHTQLKLSLYLNTDKHPCLHCLSFCVLSGSVNIDTLLLSKIYTTQIVHLQMSNLKLYDI